MKYTILSKFSLSVIAATALIPLGTAGLYAQSGPPVPPAPPTPAPTATPTPGSTPSIPGGDLPAIQPGGLRGGSNLSTDLGIENPQDLNITPDVVIYFNLLADTNAAPPDVLASTENLVRNNPEQGVVIVGNAARTAPTQDVANAVAQGAIQGATPAQAPILAGSIISSVFQEFAPGVANVLVTTAVGSEVKVTVAASILTHLPYAHTKFAETVASALAALKSDALVIQALQLAISENPQMAKYYLDAAEEAFPHLKDKIANLR